MVLLAIAAGINLIAPAFGEEAPSLCTDCHSKTMTPAGISSGACSTCHDNPHGIGGPKSYTGIGRKTIHNIHSVSVTNQCQECHAPQPTCNSCHGLHRNVPNMTVQESRDCQKCHGILPNPLGHNEVRRTFQEGMHKWVVRCSTCHRGAGLQFKNLADYPLANSSQLCSICHSEQYSDPGHYTISSSGAEEKKCVDCHNPHGTTKTGSFELPPSLTGFLGEKFDALKNNMVFVILAVLLVMSMVFEYYMKPKRGKAAHSKTLRIEHDRAKAAALKIIPSVTPDSKTISRITAIIERNGARIIGMTSQEKEIAIFLSRESGENDEKILKELRELREVKEADYTDKYELK